MSDDAGIVQGHNRARRGLIKDLDPFKISTFAHCAPLPENNIRKYLSILTKNRKM
jgi:hypothetical protein